MIYIGLQEIIILIVFRDLGINSLTTLNKMAFRGLTYLTELDLFDNEIDYLPPDIFRKLNSLVYL